MITAEIVMTPYDALKAYGHSPAKAAEIALDAKRGDTYALQWLDAATRALPPAVASMMEPTK